MSRGPFTTWQAALEQLQARRSGAEELGGPEAIDRQHRAGKLTVRERIAVLTESFQEVGKLATAEIPGAGGKISRMPAGYVCGLATVDGRKVAVGGEDYTVQRGAATTYLDRIKGGMGGFVEDLAHEYRIPLVMLQEGVGGDVAVQDQKGHAYVASSFSFNRCFELLGEVPVLTAVLGPTAGGTAARAAITHFSVMTKNAYVFAGGPPLVRRATGHDVSKEELGGWEVHACASGLIDNVATDDEDAITQLRSVLGYLPQNVWELPPLGDSSDPVDRPCDRLLEIVPEQRRRTYDMRGVIREVFDAESFFEIGGGWGRSLVTGLARVGGYVVGVIANNPQFLGGAMDAAAADKQVRFLDMCSTFHLPVVYFVDVPGFMIGVEAERAAVLRHGVRAVQSLLECESPVLTIHVRRAYGMAVNATSSPDRLGLRIAWPSVEIGDMPIEGGVDAGFRHEIEQATDPEAMRREIEERMLASADSWGALEAFAIEDVIDPRETRMVIATFLEAARTRTRTTLGPPSRPWRPRP